MTTDEGSYECAECGADDHPSSECPNKDPDEDVKGESVLWKKSISDRVQELLAAQDKAVQAAMEAVSHAGAADVYWQRSNKTKEALHALTKKFVDDMENMIKGCNCGGYDSAHARTCPRYGNDKPA